MNGPATSLPHNAPRIGPRLDDLRRGLWLAFALAVGSWSLFWAQALYRFRILPETLIAALLFCSLALGAALNRRCRHGGGLPMAGRRISRNGTLQ